LLFFVVSMVEIIQQIQQRVNNEGKGGCMKDSAGKFCLDKWTRKEEEGRVGKKVMRKLPMKP